jgi:hypothetical protein
MMVLEVFGVVLFLCFWFCGLTSEGSIEREAKERPKDEGVICKGAENEQLSSASTCPPRLLATLYAPLSPARHYCNRP